ncbi:MAG: 30S ribosomal protein THX [Chitinophagales bacterium]|nr:30S ribosomal protein THX [Chitinophagales bacterium]MDW8428821.1 30S ribosomal protein THX [Chitinophagales bacterium]
MGKGDPRTRRGKLFRGTFGVTRPHKEKKKSSGAASAPQAEPASSAKSARSRKNSA